MSKGKIYFSHDADAHSDTRLLALINKYGFEGYGWYFRIVEQLTKEQDHRLSIGGKLGMNAIEQMLNVCSTECQRTWNEHATVTRMFIEDCVNVYELFVTDGDFIWSESHIERMKKVDAKKVAASLAGKASGRSRRLKVKKLKTSKGKKTEPGKSEPDEGEKKDVNGSSTLVERVLNNININRNINRNIKYIISTNVDINTDLPFSPESEFFNSEKFVEVWNDYMTVRDEKKYKAWTKTEIKKQWNKLMKFSGGKINSVVDHIEAASAGGWKGFWQIESSETKKVSIGKVNEAYEQAHKNLSDEF